MAPLPIILLCYKPSAFSRTIFFQPKHKTEEKTAHFINYVIQHVNPDFTDLQRVSLYFIKRPAGPSCSKGG